MFRRKEEKNYWQKRLGSGRKAQLAAFFTFVLAALMLMLALTLNLTQQAQLKLSISQGADKAALELGSRLSSHAWMLRQKYLDGKRRKCKRSWTMFFYEVIEIVGYALAIVTLGATALISAGVSTVAGVALSGLTSIAGMGTMGWAALGGMSGYMKNANAEAFESIDRMFQNLAREDQFLEKAIQTALSSAVTDPTMVIDRNDIDADGETDDLIPYWAVWWQERLKLKAENRVDATLFVLTEFISIMTSYITVLREMSYFLRHKLLPLTNAMYQCENLRTMSNNYTDFDGNTAIERCGSTNQGTASEVSFGIWPRNRRKNCWSWVRESISVPDSDCELWATNPAADMCSYEDEVGDCCDISKCNYNTCWAWFLGKEDFPCYEQYMASFSPEGTSGEEDLLIQMERDIGGLPPDMEISDEKGGSDVLNWQFAPGFVGSFLESFFNGAIVDNAFDAFFDRLELDGIYEKWMGKEDIYFDQTAGISGLFRFKKRRGLGERMSDTLDRSKWAWMDELFQTKMEVDFENLDFSNPLNSLRIFQDDEVDRLAEPGDDDRDFVGKFERWEGVLDFWADNMEEFEDNCRACEPEGECYDYSPSGDANWPVCGVTPLPDEQWGCNELDMQGQVSCLNTSCYWQQYNLRQSWCDFYFNNCQTYCTNNFPDPADYSTCVDGCVSTRFECLDTAHNDSVSMCMNSYDDCEGCSAKSCCKDIVNDGVVTQRIFFAEQRLTPGEAADQLREYQSHMFRLKREIMGFIVNILNVAFLETTAFYPWQDKLGHHAAFVYVSPFKLPYLKAKTKSGGRKCMRLRSYEGKVGVVILRLDYNPDGTVYFARTNKFGFFNNIIWNFQNFPIAAYSIAEYTDTRPPWFVKTDMSAEDVFSAIEDIFGSIF